ncbi:DUF2891 domain-containing protein [Foetidibacter luteolus]|uniref:DUF2891 domain-containing protein n=1 Tax=Foetidibacter luteolus TaxID=2608880 RepID=UPI00129B9EAC|nr:DUF2891 domain-containing protein [Foetidibacter luteolus]
MRIVLTVLCFFLSLLLKAQQHYSIQNLRFTLTQTGASHFAQLPLRCMQQEFPYKTGITYTDTSLIAKPKAYHPAFYGCFDWHSSVHGHWMLVRLLKLFPSLPEAAIIKQKLSENLSAANIQTELKIFQQKDNRGLERTYGWGWLLQLQAELLTWNDSLGKQLSANLQPLAQYFSGAYIAYLKKLVYPIRVGEHSNLAFGLRLAWDYAAQVKDDSLQLAIKTAAMRFYYRDKACPLSWEPGGNDFLSPCLEEADLMWRVLPAAAYQKWIKAFLPQLFNTAVNLQPGQVIDRSDGKLVHLDGLNLSRAWCLYGIAEHAGAGKTALLQLANKHIESALPHVASGDYMGEHWLASFAVYALTSGDR